MLTKLNVFMKMSKPILEDKLPEGYRRLPTISAIPIEAVVMPDVDNFTAIEMVYKFKFFP